MSSDDLSYRGVFIGAIAAVIALLVSQYAKACDYTPAPVTVPPQMEVKL